MQKKLPAFFMLLCLVVNYCLASEGFQKSAGRIPDDTITRHHIVIRNHFDAGVIFRLGRQHVRTYDDYDHSTTKTDNYIVGRYARFLTLRMAHGFVFKKTFEAGITYGADIDPHPNDTRVFVPLMLHVIENVRLTKKLALLAVERDGYAFYIRRKENNPFLQAVGAEGGFASETLIGLSISNRKRSYLHVMFGYRFQQIRSKSIYYPDQSIMQVGGVYATLPNKITEISEGVYHFVYLSLGVPF